MDFKILPIAILLVLATSNAYAEDSTKYYNVLFEDGADKSIAANYGEIETEFKIINGVVIKATEENAQLLSQEIGILSVEEDKPITIEQQDLLQSDPRPKEIHTMESYTPGSQWNLGETGVNAEAAWSQWFSYYIKGATIEVAIIDTGVDYTRDDLTNLASQGMDFCDTGDPSGNSNSPCTIAPTPMDPLGHGTAMASAIVGQGIEVMGVAPMAKYHPLKITNDAGTWRPSQGAQAIEWALEQNTDIIYFGLEFYSSDTLHAAYVAAYEQGILVIGPSYSNGQIAPGGDTTVLGVGAHSQDEPQTVMPSTGNYAEFLAPGENVLVLELNGGVTTDDGPDIAAAQAAGAAAAIVDMNKLFQMGFTNNDIWDTLSYSSDDLWPAEPQAGYGRLDLNSAANWMIYGWYFDYDINYMDYNAGTDYTAAYYPGNPIRYTLTLKNHSERDFPHLDVNSFHVKTDTLPYEKILGVEDHNVNGITLPKQTEMTLGPFEDPHNPEMDANSNGTMAIFNFGSSGQYRPEPGSDWITQKGRFIIAKEQSGAELHLTDMPYYNKEQGHYNGAAVAKMILDFVRSDVNATDNNVTQDQIYEYAYQFKDEGNSGSLELDADAMDAVLGKYDPYDFIVSDQFDTYDDLNDGNPNQGYNYNVDYHDDMAEYMKNVVHWMAWQVTQRLYWYNGELAAHPNTPAALPIFGTYDRWVALNGYSVSQDPTPDPFRPNQVKDFNVYGFWITDPELGETLGSHVFVTAQEAQETYFLPVDTNDVYDGNFLQIAEPPDLSNLKSPLLEETAAMPFREAKRPIGQEFPAIEGPLKAIKPMASTSDLLPEPVREPIVKIAEPVPMPQNLETIMQALNQ